MLRATESLALVCERNGYFPSCYLCYGEVPEVTESVILAKIKVSQVIYFHEKKIGSS